MKKLLRLLISSFPRIHINWDKIEKRGDRTFQVGWRLAVLLLLLGICIFIFRGLQDDGFSIQTFDVPKSLNESGYTGVVLARKLVDELGQVEAFVSSVKEDAINSIQNQSDKPDLDVEVMGIGLTINAVTYHLRELLGRPNRSIRGELTDIDQQLSLTLRITDAPTRTFRQSYNEGQRGEAIQLVLHEAAKGIIETLDPYRIAVYHYKKENFPAALEQIGTILKERPEEADWAYVAWGNILDQKGDIEGAIEKFELATQLNPNLEVAWNNWAWLEFRKKNYEGAIDIFEKVSKFSDNPGGAWNSIAWCYRNMGNYDAAHLAYEKAIKKDRNIDWYSNKADLYAAQGDTTRALSLLEQMLSDLELTGIQDYFSRATYYKLLGRRDSVQLQLEKIRQLDPNHFWTTRWLFFSYDEGKEYQKLIDLAPELIRLAPTQNQMNEKDLRQAIHNIVAMSLYEIQQFDSAFASIQLSIQEKPETAYPYTTLAEIYGLQGKDELFYSNLEKALIRGFDPAELLDAEPYWTYEKQARYIDLIEKYQKPKEDEALANKG